MNEVEAPLVNEAYLTLRPYVPGKPVEETQRELGLTDVIKLASNENPLGPSPRAVEAIRRAADTTHDYPDGSCFHLKRALAEKHRVDPSAIIVGNGSNEVIEWLVRTVVRPGENMLFADPSFIAYRLAAQAAGVEIRSVPLTADLRYDLPAMAEAADHRTKLVFIANPNNPTGRYVTDAELRAFLDRLPPQVVVVIDEAYVEYVDAPDYPDGWSYAVERPRTVVLRTFSKCYGLAGLRVGYGLADPSLIDFLNRGRQPFNVNLLAQAGALGALGDEEHVRRSVSLNRAERGRVAERLEAMGYRVTPSQANFLLVDAGEPTATLYRALLLRGVIVREMQPYGLEHCVRVSLGTRDQNDRFLAALMKER